VMRWFHGASSTIMVATNSLRQELSERGFRKIGAWTRGVDTNLFTPDNPAKLDLPRPIFMTVGRVAVEKNLEAFLSLDLPGSKVVVGDGPQRAELERRFPEATFLGEKFGMDLASQVAAADVFVFPSLTDTFGVVQLEALACGTPVAALGVSRETCRNFALERSWENSARQFIGNLAILQPGRSQRHAPVVAGSSPVRG
jgi:glycosyltransferase involved in cell wall biosynthesis